MRLDQDGDGVLTEEEAGRIRGGDDEPAAERRGFSFEALLQNADKDGDGKISAAEWPGRPEMFQRLDADGDGLFTAEEGQRHERPRVGQRGDRVDPAQIFIRMLDKSGDGQVSNSEWTDWFGGADENADGLLSHAELTKKLQETMRPQPQPAVEE
jgi:Ca2+-binding EF-hand superfamily protein